jgi:hypothetical protein
MVWPMPPQKGTYTQEEVTEILKRALHQERLGDRQLSHQELVEMAAEIGIGRDALDAATTELAQRQVSDLAARTQANELAQERSRQLTAFVSSLVSLLGIGALVYLLQARLGLGVWVYWVLLAWGILVVLRLRHVVFPQEKLARRKRKERRMLEREEKKARRAAFREEMRRRLRGGPSFAQAEIERGAQEFEQAVQVGVSALLSAAARKIQEHAERSRRNRP